MQSQSCNFIQCLQVQCPPLNRITLGQHKSDNNNWLIQLTDIFVYCWGKMGPAVSDYNKRLILLSVIQLNGGHSIDLLYSQVLEKKHWCRNLLKMSFVTITEIGRIPSGSLFFINNSLLLDEPNAALKIWIIINFSFSFFSRWDSPNDITLQYNGHKTVWRLE